MGILPHKNALSHQGGAVWIPALSAIGAGFAIGLAAIGSGVGQALGLGACTWPIGFRCLGFRV